jgi:hypothetical protein
MDAREERAAQAQIRVIEEVLRRWDATGRSEAHAPGILGKLRAGASVDDLTRHLHALTRAQGNIEHDRLFATELVSWWVDRSGAI